MPNIFGPVHGSNQSSDDFEEFPASFGAGLSADEFGGATFSFRSDFIRLGNFLYVNRLRPKHLGKLDRLFRCQANGLRRLDKLRISQGLGLLRVQRLGLWRNLGFAFTKSNEHLLLALGQLRSRLN